LPFKPNAQTPSKKPNYTTLAILFDTEVTHQFREIHDLTCIPSIRSESRSSLLVIDGKRLIDAKSTLMLYPAADKIESKHFLIGHVPSEKFEEQRRQIVVVIEV
jgi:hypothetical protein